MLKYMQNNIELMGTTTKTVKGRTYLYFTYYDPNTKSKKETYCGLAGNPRSTKNALEFESNRLKKQQKNLSNRIMALDKKISGYRARKIEST